MRIRQIFLLSCIVSSLPEFVQSESTEDTVPIPPEKSFLNARLERPDGGYGIEASLLFWTPTGQGTPYAASTPLAHQNSQSSVTGPYSHPNFKVDWGFRVGINGETSQDGWGASVTYTWINAFATGTTVIDTSTTRLYDLLSTVSVTQAGAYPKQIYDTWRFLYNDLNFFFGRTYKFSEWVDFNAFFGLHVLWYHTTQNNIDTGVNVQQIFNGAPAYYVTQRQRHTVVGPIAGLHSYLDLGAGFSLSGGTSFGAGYGPYRGTPVEYTSKNNAQTTYANNKLHQQLALFQCMTCLGLGWDSSFKDWFDFGISLAWEANVLAGAPFSLGGLKLGEVIGFSGGTLSLSFQF